MLTNFPGHRVGGKEGRSRNNRQWKWLRQTQVAIDVVGFRRQKWAFATSNSSSTSHSVLSYPVILSHTVRPKANNGQSVPDPKVFWEHNRASLSLAIKNGKDSWDLWSPMPFIYKSDMQESILLFTLLLFEHLGTFALERSHWRIHHDFQTVTFRKEGTKSMSLHCAWWIQDFTKFLHLSLQEKCFLCSVSIPATVQETRDSGGIMRFMIQTLSLWHESVRA